MSDGGPPASRWPVRRLKYAVAVNPPGRIASGDGDLPVSFVPMEAVGEYGGLDLATSKLASEIGSGYTRFQDGDVLVAKITPCFENGKGAIACDLVNGAGFGTTELHVLRPGPGVDAGYLFYLTISIPFRDTGKAAMYGAGGQKRVPTEFVRDFAWPFPPLNDQRKITTYLNRKTVAIDAIIRKKSRLIDVLHERVRTVTHHAVNGGPDCVATCTMSDAESPRPIPSGWKVMQLHRVGRFVGGTGFPHEYQGREDEALPFFKVEDTNHPENGVYLTRATNTISESDARQLRVKPVNPGAILFPKVGAALLGNKRRIVIRRSVFDNNMMALIPHHVSTKFLYYWFTTIDLGRFSNPGPVPSINESQVREISLPLPSESEQVEVAASLDELTTIVETAINRLRRQIDRLREYRQTLISAAVTGKLDVRASAATRAQRGEPALTA